MEIRDRFESLVQRMRKGAEPDDFGDPVSEAEIREAETELGVSFPESYKWFLKEFGFAYWPGEIYGLGKRCPLPYDVVMMTEDEREEVEPKMPPHLVPFHPDGFGNHYCFDTSRLVEGECPVVFWNHEDEEDQQPKQTHASFLDWLEEWIRFREEGG